MKLYSQPILFDRETGALMEALDGQAKADRPLPLLVNGLSGGAVDALCARLIRRGKERGAPPTLLLVGEEREGRALTDVLCQDGLSVLFYPYRDLLFDPISASHDLERERLFVLYSLAKGLCDAVVTTPAAALLFTMPRERLLSLALHPEVGAEMSPDRLTARLTEMGYVRVETVESAGQLARRGDILDVCDRTGVPLRIEFFGDEIDRMGHFDPDTQRLTDGLSSATVLPAREVIPGDVGKAAVLAHIKTLLKSPKDPSADKLLRGERASLEAGTDGYARDRYLSLLYPEHTSLLSYLAPHTACVLVSSSELAERTEGSLSLLDETARASLEAGIIGGKAAVYSHRYSDLEEALRHLPSVWLNQFAGVSPSMRAAGLFGFRCRHTPKFTDNFKQLCEDLEERVSLGYRVLLLCQSDAEADHLAASLTEASIPVSRLGEAELSEQTLPPGVVTLAVGACRAGYELPTPKVSVFVLAEDKSVPRRRRPQKKQSAGERILSMNELSPGDFVVHEVYGIGRFEGITAMTLEGVTRDYITLRYAGTDTLFVPADRLEQIGKYIGAGASDGTVKLSKMGAPEWQRAKSKAKGAAKLLARDLIDLYARRMRRQGFAFPADSELEREFELSFPYEETEPQLVAAEEIKADMRKTAPMDRLLCGDVGFGKTEVAFRAAFKAICAGKQVAILVPTTVLALQHYQTALARMRAFAVNVGMLSRLSTPKERSLTLRRLARGDIDLIIGTHSLLSKQVAFKDLGLVIVDEEQRFGVAQKEKLKTLCATVDVLTLTATPIPRTLHMAMSGIRDMSVLDEAPEDRFPVQTYVTEYDEGLLTEAMERELRRGGQVLYLKNRAEHLPSLAAKLKVRLPDARISYAHGQMDKEELEQIWQATYAGEIDILVCTTIIETGIDLPSANTLIVEDADRMGLSQLHQLRGRVGRSGRRAYAYFTYRTGKALTDIAAKRLEAIREYAEFGAGFRIAMRDLEIRGAGNLLGAEQHGNIESVGYDLYIRLLEEAILEEQGQPKEVPFEAQVDIPVDAHLPERYIPSTAHRMDLYKKISHIATEADRDDLFDELCDRFGEPPAPAAALLDVALLRATASFCRVGKIEARGRELRFRAAPLCLAVWSELFAEFPALRMTGGTEPFVAMRVAGGSTPLADALAVMLRYRAVYLEETNQKEEQAHG